MTSAGWFALLVLGTAAVRVAELRVAARNVARAFAAGGREHGRGHYPAMVAVHVGLLAACLAEVFLLDRPFVPLLGWLALTVVAAAHALRWWCIASLGWRWNTRVVVVDGLPLVRRGPYRHLRHPNYVAVVAEVAALPLVHSAWLTALVFSALNAWVLSVRVRVENRALAAAAP